MKTINIIGAGNVAYHLAIALHRSGKDIKAIYNRTHEKALNLAARCDSEAIKDISYLPHSDLTIISVSDDAITALSHKLAMIPNTPKAVIHTSGVLDINQLSKKIENTGCIWPLQSLIQGDDVDLTETPLCIDASNSAFLKTLMAVCTDISNQVTHMPSDQKKYAHVAAVIANNFSNHLYHLAASYSKEHDLDFKILLPLIQESVLKLKNQNPEDIQTGPARRNDSKTINKHLRLIKDKSLRKVYRTITKSIINTYHEDH